MRFCDDEVAMRVQGFWLEVRLSFEYVGYVGLGLGSGRLAVGLRRSSSFDDVYDDRTIVYEEITEERLGLRDGVAMKEVH